MPHNHAATSIIRNMIHKDANQRPKMKNVVTEIDAILKRGDVSYRDSMANTRRNPPLHRRGQNELHRAVQDGDVDLVMELIRRGVDIDATDESGRAALDLAALNNRAYVAERLLEEGADVNSADENGSTALCWAADSGHTKLVKMLLEAEVDVDAYNEAYGKTALKVAANSGKDNVVKMLLNAGADVNQFTRAELKQLSRNGSHELSQMLLEAQADI